MSDNEPPILIKFNADFEVHADFEEVVYSDRTYGQYDSGAIYSLVVFVSRSGDVYKHGTSELIGIAPEIQEEWENYDPS